MELRYKTGNVLEPTESGSLLLVHNCNNLGVMGAGIAAGIRAKWPHVYEAYHEWYNDSGHEDVIWSSADSMCLGDIQIVAGQQNINIVNLIGQKEFSEIHGIPPIRYEAIREGLYHLRYYYQSLKEKPNIISPKFGAGLSKGLWSDVEKLIIEAFGREKLTWTVYSL